MSALMVIGLCLMLPLVITMFACGISEVVKVMKDPLGRIIVILIMFVIYIVGFVLFTLSL